MPKSNPPIKAQPSTAQPVDIIAELKSRQFNQDTKIKDSTIYFTIRDRVVGTSSNMITLVGLPKSRKSTVLAMCIASALLQQTINGLQMYLHPNKKKSRIAIFDTEQSEYDFDQKMNIIRRITGTENIFDQFDAYLLNDCTPGQIIRYITAYLDDCKECGICIIDGLLDLIDNMNDEVKSKQLIRYIKKLAKAHDCLIVSVLHLGKKDRLSLGHLGSASDRAAQSVIEIEKTKDDHILIKSKMMRSDRDFEDIELRWSDRDRKYLFI